MTDPSLERVIGGLEAQVHSMGNAIALLTNKVDTLDNKLDGVDKVLSEARGGWRTLIWIAGASSALGGVATYLASLFIPPKI